jgi:hypothetical protein
LHGGTREDSDGRSLSSATEAMLGVVFEGVLRVIYRSLFIGLSDIGQNFEEAIILPSTSKSRVITTLTILRQPPNPGIVGKLKISAFSMCY